MIKFSIIIPVRKINAYLKESIPHLQALDYQEYEVIIITDEPETYDFGGDARFKIISSGSVGPAEKRNIGAAAAVGGILAFMDDDAFPLPNWLAEAAKVFEDSQVYALGGPAMTPPSAGFLERMSGLVLESWLTSGGTIYRHLPMKSRKINDYPTVNLLVRKEVFDRVGGFDTEFWPGEDTKLCLDLLSSEGRPFDYRPEVQVYHHRRNLFFPHLKQISRYGMHRGQFARIFPQTSRLPAFFAPSAFVIGLVFGPAVCLVLPFLWSFYHFVVSFYLALLLVEGAKVLAATNSLRAALYVIAGIFTTHLVYGANFIVGILRRPKLKLRGVDTSTGDYLGG